MRCCPIANKEKNIEFPKLLEQKMFSKLNLVYVLKVCWMKKKKKLKFGLNQNFWNGKCFQDLKGIEQTRGLP